MLHGAHDDAEQERPRPAEITGSMVLCEACVNRSPTTIPTATTPNSQPSTSRMTAASATGIRIKVMARMTTAIGATKTVSKPMLPTMKGWATGLGGRDPVVDAGTGSKSMASAAKPSD